jgi:hypothetical protein
MIPQNLGMMVVMLAENGQQDAICNFNCKNHDHNA